jgi:hypothetical protein
VPLEGVLRIGCLNLCAWIEEEIARRWCKAIDRSKVNLDEYHISSAFNSPEATQCRESDTENFLKSLGKEGETGDKKSNTCTKFIKLAPSTQA